MTWIILWLLSLFVSYTWDNLTGEIQREYIVQSYFYRTNSFDTLHWRSWRVLWQQFPDKTVRWWQLTNRTDCGGTIIWHMIHLWIIDWRFHKWVTFDWWWLNSYRLYRLWKNIKRSLVKTWDFIYMEMSWWVRHVWVSCNEWWTMIYDLYKSDKMACRKLPRYERIYFATNGAYEYLEKKKIVLDDVKKIIDEIYTMRDSADMNNCAGNILCFRYWYEKIGMRNVVGI